MITRAIRGRKAKFCGDYCAKNYRADRAAGLIYPPWQDEAGGLISHDEASVKYGFCAYCFRPNFRTRPARERRVTVIVGAGT
jgi:hypothetical protein